MTGNESGKSTALRAEAGVLAFAGTGEVIPTNKDRAKPVVNILALPMLLSLKT